MKHEGFTFSLRASLWPQEIWDINALVKTLHADVTAKLTEFVDLRIQVERAQDTGPNEEVFQKWWPN